MKTLILSGILNEDGTFQLHIPFTADPAYIAPLPISRATGDEVVEIDLLGDKDIVLARTLIDARLTCSSTLRSMSPLSMKRQISGLVALPEDMIGLRMRWRGRVIYNARAPSGHPTVHFTWKPPTNSAVSGFQLVTWQVSHPNEVPMHFLLFTQERDGTRLAVASIMARRGELTSASQILLNTANLSPGTVCLSIIVSDGFHQSSAMSEPFTISKGSTQSIVRQQP